MPKNTEKINRNKIREKYAHEYAQKLRSRDAVIRQLEDENKALKAEISSLEEKASLDRITILKLDELVKKLQECADMSDKDLDNLKADLERRRGAMDAAKRIDDMANAMFGAMGSKSAIGATSLAGLLGSMLYGPD